MGKTHPVNSLTEDDRPVGQIEEQYWKYLCNKLTICSKFRRYACITMSNKAYQFTIYYNWQLNLRIKPNAIAIAHDSSAVRVASSVTPAAFKSLPRDQMLLTSSIPMWTE
jgi:hypothetical protein